MKKIYYKLLISIFTISIIFSSGCSLFNRDMGRAESYEVIEIDSEDKMKDDTYYVKKKNGKFHQLYIGNTNFQKTANSYPNPLRVAWYGKDFDKIPTMYQGETLVYHAKTPFKEGVYIERFIDSGFTIGLSKLDKTETGRYMFSTSPGDYYMDINSSAGQMYELGDKKAILDTIGNAKLREGNISPSGTIIGLEEGKTYSTYVYIGTQAHHYNIVADVRALTSSEVTRLWDYEFDKNKVLEFKFPNNFNSGYYFVNGKGIVRYINSNKKWDDSMDMNIPNDYDENKDHEDKSTGGRELTLESQTVENVPVNIDTDGRYSIEVSYEIVKDMPEPTIKFIGSNGTISLKPAGDDVMAIQTDLEAGKYELQLIGLDGRAYSYRVVDADNNAIDNTDNETNQDNEDTKNEQPETTEDENEQNDDDKKESSADIIKKELEKKKK